MIPTQLFPLSQSLNFQGHLDQRGGGGNILMYLV